VTGQLERSVSSLELLLQGKLEPVEKARVPLQAGTTCPACGKGKLNYNGLLAWNVPNAAMSAAKAAVAPDNQNPTPLG